MKGLSLRNLLRIGYLAIALVMAAIVLTSLWQARKAEEHLRSIYEGSVKIQRQAVQLRNMVATLNRSALYATLSGSKAELSQASTHSELFFLVTQSMRENIQQYLNSPEREEALADTNEIEDAFRESVSSTVVLLGDYIETRHSDKSLLTRIRLTTQIFEDKVEELAVRNAERTDQHIARLRAEADQAILNQLALAGIVAIMIIIGFLVLQQRLSVPLAALSKFLEQAGRDPVGIETRYLVRSGDEIGGVGKAVNDLLDHLQETSVSRDQFEQKERSERSRRENLEVEAAVAEAWQDVSIPFGERARRALEACKALKGCHPEGGVWFRANEFAVTGEEWIRVGQPIWARTLPELAAGNILIDPQCNHALPEHGHYFVSLASGDEVIGHLVVDTCMNPPTDSSRQDCLHNLGQIFTFGILSERAMRRESAALREAEISNRAKTEFLSNMGHELRTPLNGILGMNQLLGTTTLDEEQAGFVQTVQESAEQLLTLINGILAFSALEAGTARIETVVFNLPAAFDEAVAAHRSMAASKHLKLSAHPGDGVPKMVAGDPHHLRQVLHNLIGNALKFSQQGEVVVRVLTSGDRIRFEVQDAGVGIPVAKLDKLFKSFSQADGSSTRRYGGVGIGLAMSKRLVELMGGEIGVESEEGQGSLFWFNLPLKAVDEDAVAHTPTSAIATAAESNQLVFDEDEMLRQLSGDREIARVLLEALVPDINASFERLSSALEAGDLSVALSEVKSLKGLAGSGGAVWVRTAADEIETHCGAGDAEAARDVLPTLAYRIQDVLPRWQKFMESPA
jgi:signal transduction histidine kinase/HPt (histidine-containing phosphotransfer) domain-containing protein